jgi:pimeloyl-ACP methyl ester carboxylesterase
VRKRSHPDARPSLLLQALEMPRAVAEYGAMVSAAALLQLAPRGDGTPVVVLPGFTGTDGSTFALRATLERLGHRPVPWGLGRNIGPTREILTGVDDLVRRLADLHGVPVQLVGWSLGGVFARHLAATRPEHVRRVITLSSPYRLSDTRRSRANRVYERYAHLHDAAIDLPVGGPASQSLSMPATSVYSKTDGIVPWGSCTEPESDLAENVAVYGSHNGLGHNPLVAYVIADRLALPAGELPRFVPPPSLRTLYGRSA